MSTIYAIQSEEGGPVKIGVTSDLPKRLRALNTSAPTNLLVKVSFSGGRAVEKALHAMLSDYRLSGEWFVDCEHVWDALEKARVGVLWAPDDWEKAALALRQKGLSYQKLSELFGYSREYIRQRIQPGYRQPAGCMQECDKERALALRAEGVPLKQISARLGFSYGAIRQLFPPAQKEEGRVNPTGIAKAVASAGSQTALAELLGVTQQAVSKWEARGWAPLERARQIANAFPIPLKDLIDPKIREML